MVCDQNKVIMINPSHDCLELKMTRGKILVTDYANRQNYDFEEKSDFYMKYLFTLELL